MIVGYNTQESVTDTSFLNAYWFFFFKDNRIFCSGEDMLKKEHVNEKKLDN